MRRALRWVGIVVVLLGIALGWVWYSAFGTNLPIVDGQSLAPGVETVKDGFVSLFVLDVGPGKVALVDAGKDASGGALLAALARRGHLAACKLFPKAEVFALGAEVPLIGDAATVSHPLQDGDVARVGELRVEAFAVPGHTPGSAVYLARGVLFFGDSAGASKDGVMTKAVRIFSKDSRQNVASLKALAARLAPRAAEVKELAFAHTGPLEGLAPLASFAGREP